MSSKLIVTEPVEEVSSLAYATLMVIFLSVLIVPILETEPLLQLSEGAIKPNVLSILTLPVFVHFVPGKELEKSSENSIVELLVLLVTVSEPQPEIKIKKNAVNNGKRILVNKIIFIMSV